MSDNTVNSNVLLTKFQKKQIKKYEKRNKKLMTKRVFCIKKTDLMQKKIDNQEAKISIINEKINNNLDKIENIKAGKPAKEKKNCDTSL